MEQPGRKSPFQPISSVEYTVQHDDYEEDRRPTLAELYQMVRKLAGALRAYDSARLTIWDNEGEQYEIIGGAVFGGDVNLRIEKITHGNS